MGAIDSINNSRKSQGKFKSLDDFCQRVDSRLVNRKVIESLIKCGTLDSFGVYRAQLMTMLNGVLECSWRIHQYRQKGQLSFFDTDMKLDGFKLINTNSCNQIKEWPEPQLLAFEKEMLGFYISGHPLARYAKEIKRFSQISTGELSRYKDGDLIGIVGLIVKIKQTLTRQKQEKMAILKLEDLDGIVEVLIFPNAFRQVYKDLLLNSIVLIKGRLNLKEDIPKIIAQDLVSIERIYKLISSININLSGIKENLFASLKERLASSAGRVPVYLHLDSPSKARIQLIVGDEFFVEPTENLIYDIESILGEGKVSLVF
jgi:DNA polymerase-3 subunit alpha